MLVQLLKRCCFLGINNGDVILCFKRHSIRMMKSQKLNNKGIFLVSILFRLYIFQAVSFFYGIVKSTIMLLVYQMLFSF